MLGLAGSFLPIIPGTTDQLVWPTFFTLHLQGEQDWHFLGWTLVIALIIMVLDYLIPIWGTKAFGGSKAGAIGAQWAWL
jgi:uncharacterized protein YqgC (DUF456 family)